MTRFGRHLRPLWHLEPQGTFLNHGSFGACPKEVLAAQAQIREGMERQPDLFYRRRARPISAQNELRVSAARLASFVGTNSERIAFVVNATEAANTVLHALTLKPGDEVMVLDCVYNAVRLAAEDICRRAGATVVKVPLPLPFAANDLVERIADAASNRTRLAIIDHIASATAIVFPVAEITRALKAKGVRVFVDGAHALGQLDLDLPDIGADWYTANAHNWLYAPKSAAFLYAAPDVAAHTLPLSVSHWHALGFPLAFDYVGTRDVSAFLSVPKALDFIAQFGEAAVRSYLTELSREGERLMRGLDARPVAPDGMFAAMRAYILPQSCEPHADDALELMNTLWDRHQVQVASNVFQGKLLLRLSAQIYVERADLEYLAEILVREGWPGRA